MLNNDLKQDLLDKELEEDRIMNIDQDPTHILIYPMFEYDTPPITGMLKLGRTKFEVEKYDGRCNYLLWKCYVKSVLWVFGMGRVMTSTLEGVIDNKWESVQL